MLSRAFSTRSDHGYPALIRMEPRNPPLAENAGPGAMAETAGHRSSLQLDAVDLPGKSDPEKEPSRGAGHERPLWQPLLDLVREAVDVPLEDPPHPSELRVEPPRGEEFGERELRWNGSSRGGRELRVENGVTMSAGNRPADPVARGERLGKAAAGKDPSPRIQGLQRARLDRGIMKVGVRLVLDRGDSVLVEELDQRALPIVRHHAAEWVVHVRCHDDRGDRTPCQCRLEMLERDPEIRIHRNLEGPQVENIESLDRAIVRG